MKQLVLFKFVLTTIILLVIGVLGYFIFLGFINKNQLLLSTFPLAIVAGLASFFSPCAFPLLPAAVATNLKQSAKTNPLIAGVVSSLGVATFLLLFGLVIGFIGQSLGVILQSNLAVIRAIVGIFLIFLAYSQFSEKFHFGFFEKMTPKTPSPFLYGFGYTLAGSGCTVPILTGLVLASLASGGFKSAFASFILAGAVMAILMFVFISLIGTLKVSGENISVLTPKIKKASSLVLFLVGGFFIANALFKIV